MAATATAITGNCPALLLVDALLTLAGLGAIVVESGLRTELPARR